MTKKFIQHDNIKKLKRLMRAEKDVFAKDKIRAVIMISKGVKYSEIAESLGYSLRWVSYVSQNYSKDGLSAIITAKYKGSESLLSPDRVIKLYEIILEGPTEASLLSRFRISDIINIVKEKWGIEYSVGGMHGLLTKMQLSHKTYRPNHPKNDPEIMASWKKKPKISLTKKKRNSTILNSGFKMKPDMDKKV